MAYDIETIVWTAGLIAAGAALVWLFRGVRRRIRHGGNLDALPQQLSGEGKLQGGSFAGKRSALGGELIAEARDLPEDERDIVLHALWHAMLLEAASDGSIDGPEIRFIADFFGHLSGRKLAYDGAMEAGELVAANPQSALTEITKARGAGAPSREHILKGAFLVSLADGALIASEANRLGDIADALNFSVEERQQLYSDVTRHLEDGGRKR